MSEASSKSTSIAAESKLVVRHTSVYAVGNFLRRIGALLLLPLYTSYLTPVDYGIKELIGISVDIASILIATAISSAIYRFYFDSEDPDQRNLVMSTSFLALGTLGILAVGALLPLAGPIAGLVLDDAGLSHFFMIAFATLWFQTLNHVSFAFLRAHQKSVQFVTISMLTFLATIGLNVYFIVSLDFGVMGILLSTLITGVLVFGVLTVPLFVRIGLHFDRTVLREMVAYGWPNVISSMAALIIRMSDRFFLKAYCSIAEAGIYSLGYRFSSVPNQFISEPFNRTWMPRRFEIARQPDAERVFGRIFTYYLCVISLAGLVVSGLTPDLLHLIADSKFWSAAQVVPVLVLANIIFTFHYHFNIGLLLEKKTKYIALVNVTNVILTVFLYWLLIPRYAAMGAASASLFAFAFKAVMTFILGRRFYKIHFEGWRAAKLLVASAVVYLVAVRLNPPTPLVSLLTKGSFIVIAYPALLMLMRFFTTDEVAKGRQVVRDRLRRLRRRRRS